MTTETFMSSSEESKGYPTQFCVLHEERLNEIISGQKEIKDLLTGGMDPSKGLLIRVDRLEQSEERKVWLLRTAIGVGVAAFISAAWNAIKRL